jgi:hypothetical protein
MTVSTLAHVVIVVAVLGGLAVMLGLLLWAARRPYFKHPHPDPMPGKVRGGVHLGDPRSQGPPENELAATPPAAASQPGPAGQPAPAGRS